MNNWKFDTNSVTAGQNPWILTLTHPYYGQICFNTLNYGKILPFFWWVCVEIKFEQGVLTCEHSHVHVSQINPLSLPPHPVKPQSNKANLKHFIPKPWNPEIKQRRWNSGSFSGLGFNWLLNLHGLQSRHSSYYIWGSLGVVNQHGSLGAPPFHESFSHSRAWIIMKPCHRFTQYLWKPSFHGSVVR